jgi:hypothetical protein
MAHTRGPAVGRCELATCNAIAATVDRSSLMVRLCGLDAAETLSTRDRDPAAVTRWLGRYLFDHT